MKRRRSCSTPGLLLALAAFAGCVQAFPGSLNETSTSAPVKYISTNAPDCEAPIAATIVTLYGRNRNLYTQCVAESLGYSLFPYSGLLPSDQEITALVSSMSCLYFLQAILSIPSLRECNLGGLDIKSAIETLLMTSEDIFNGIAPLTRSQFIEFITWRHTRNIAKQINEPYDAASESAVAFEKQLADAALRLKVSLTDDTLRIQMDGIVIGTSQNTSDAEVETRSANDADYVPATVEPSKGETSVKATGPTTVSSSASATTRYLSVTVAALVLVWVAVSVA